MSDLLDELDTWLDANWDPDLTVAEWWQRLGTSGWAAPALPANAYGKGVSRNEAIAVAQRIVARGAVPAPGGLGDDFGLAHCKLQGNGFKRCVVLPGHGDDVRCVGFRQHAVLSVF